MHQNIHKRLCLVTIRLGSGQRIAPQTSFQNASCMVWSLQGLGLLEQYFRAVEIASLLLLRSAAQVASKMRLKLEEWSISFLARPLIFTRGEVVRRLMYARRLSILAFPISPQVFEASSPRRGLRVGQVPLLGFISSA